MSTDSPLVLALYDRAGELLEAIEDDTYVEVFAARLKKARDAFAASVKSPLLENRPYSYAAEGGCSTPVGSESPITVRHLFAASALQGLFASRGMAVELYPPEKVVLLARQYADALAERMAVAKKKPSVEGKLSLTINEHTLTGEKHDGRWTFQCASWPGLAIDWNGDVTTSRMIEAFVELCLQEATVIQESD